MIDRILCVSCGGNLVPYKYDEIFKCEFCGKLYSDSEECTELEAVRKLSKKRKKEAASAMLQDLITSNPGNIVYLWEKVNLDFGCEKVSDYLFNNKTKVEKLVYITGSESYEMMKRFMMKDTLVYCKMIDQYIDVNKKINDTVKNARYLSELEEYRKSYKPSSKEVFETIISNIKKLIFGAMCGAIFGMFASINMIVKDGGISVVVFSVIFAFIGFFFAVAILIGQQAVEDSERQERYNNSNQAVAQLPKLKAQADDLLESIRHMENDRFLSVKG